MHTHETCACGSEITTNSPDQIRQWRTQHACTVVHPGPCFDDSGTPVTLSVVSRIGDKPWSEVATYRCDLRAGHAGAHECDLGLGGGGRCVWPSDESGDG